MGKLWFFYAAGGNGDVSSAFITRLPNTNEHLLIISHKHILCLFVHLRVRKVEICWTKMDGLIFHSLFHKLVLLRTFILHSCCKSSHKSFPLDVLFCVFPTSLLILFIDIDIE